MNYLPVAEFETDSHIPNQAVIRINGTYYHIDALPELTRSSIHQRPLFDHLVEAAEDE